MPDPQSLALSQSSRPEHTDAEQSVPDRTFMSKLAPAPLENVPSGGAKVHDRLITDSSESGREESEHHKVGYIVSSDSLPDTEDWNEPGTFGRFTIFTLRVWSYEILCSVTFVASFTAVIAILQFYNGKSLPSFPYGLSINAIIAIFTAVIKASVALVISEGLSHLKWTAMERLQRMSVFNTYDQASRGPWGAGLLLGKLGWKRRHVLSSVGAGILILLLPIDPLAQQIVRFQDCERQAFEMSATIPRARIFDWWTHLTHKTENTFLGSMPFFVTQAIFNPKQSLPFWSCETGNCSFTTGYSSLAYCNSCADVTERLLIEGDHVWNDLGTHIKYPTFTLSGVHRNITSTGENFIMGVDKPGVDDYRIRSNITLEISTIRTGRISRETVAFTCSLQPCIRSYSHADIERTQLKETLDSLPHTEWGFANDTHEDSYESYFAIADLHCLEDWEHQGPILRDLGYVFNESTQWLPYNVTYRPWHEREGIAQIYNESSVSTLRFDEIRPDATSYYEELLDYDDYDLRPSSEKLYVLNKTARETIPSECIYQFSNVWVSDIGSTLEGILNINSSSRSTLVTPILSNGSGNLTLSDMQNMMDRVADSLSEYIRVSIAEDKIVNLPAQGVSLQPSVCIKIRWSWVIYLAGIIAFFLIFFATMLVTSRLPQARMANSWSTGARDRTSFHYFKSSSLPLLLCGLEWLDCSLIGLIDQSDPARMTKMVSTKELEKIAKPLRIGLQPTERGRKIAVAEPGI